MAEKKKDEFRYGSAFLPDGERKYSVIRWGWNGLNRTDEIDTGQLTDMSGMVCDPPYMETRKKPFELISFETGVPFDYSSPGQRFLPIAWQNDAVPISIAGIDSDIALIFEINMFPDYNPPAYYTCMVRYTPHYDGRTKMTTNVLGDEVYSKSDVPRSIVQYNVVTDPTTPDDTLSGNIVNYIYDRKLLVYPDCYSVKYYSRNGEFGESFNTQQNPIPVSRLATVYNSRVFGATESSQQNRQTNNAVFASDFNSYAAYNLDTADDVSSNHAWWSMTNTNTDADGAVVAMCTFDNHVVLWKKGFMQLVYNNKNPFRIVDVGAFGCESNNAWTILNGVLYFADQDHVYAYTGGVPKIISKTLDVQDLGGAVLGSYRDTLWLATLEDQDSLYTYKDGVWSRADKLEKYNEAYNVRQFAATDWGLVGLCELHGTTSHDAYYKLIVFDWDWDKIGGSWVPEEWEPVYDDRWSFTTDIMALGRLDVRRPKKLSVLCEGKAGSTVSVYLLKDGEPLPPQHRKKERLVGTLTLDENGFGVLRVLTRQFSSTMHQLRFEGSGYMKIHAAEMKISWGGDVYAET